GIRDFHVTGVQTCALPICDDGVTTREAVIRRTVVSERMHRVEGITTTTPLPPTCCSTRVATEQERDPVPVQRRDRPAAAEEPDADRKSVVEGKSVQRGRPH